MTTTNESSNHIDPAVDAVTTLRAIAEFPVINQFNQDAINMKLTAQNFFHREVARKNIGEIPAGFSKSADGGPAFPHPDYLHTGDAGMTLRDYFAAKAMAGMLADPNFPGDVPETAELAYDYADALLKARG
ncbi:hypothetical protein [Burkholderia gladioli]|uniref:hypothetical protein n=1 Tax=Burkholderia gladioli TaxID=28095 RepID=UPI00163E8998|nr:hypothetical protein [Burkholderia gladioli]